MKIDVLIEYNEKLSEVTCSSKATQFTQTRPARIGLSRSVLADSDHEMVEFVGEDWEQLEIMHDLFRAEPTRKNHTLRIVNPFEPATFEPYALYRVIDFFSTYVLAEFYPKTWSLRKDIPFLNSYEMTLKIPAYKIFNPQKKEEFEKLLRKRYKRVSFVS
jgi:hypothetical protein